MPKRDFAQIAFAVVQQATGAAPKRKPKVKAAPKGGKKAKAKRKA
jgi:hypothetical protein